MKAVGTGLYEGCMKAVGTGLYEGCRYRAL